jgi:hypothetical protein
MPMTPLIADLAPPVWTTAGAMLTYAILLLVIGLTWLESGGPIGMGPGCDAGRDTRP